MGPIHLNEIDCTGFEKSITDCKFNMESQGCNHEEDAAVRCNVPAMGFQNQVRSQRAGIWVMWRGVFIPEHCLPSLRRILGYLSRNCFTKPCLKIQIFNICLALGGRACRDGASF